MQRKLALKKPEIASVEFHLYRGTLQEQERWSQLLHPQHKVRARHLQSEILAHLVFHCHEVFEGL